MAPAPNAPVIASFRTLYPFADRSAIAANEPDSPPGYGLREKLSRALFPYRNRVLTATRFVNYHTAAQNPLFVFFRRFAEKSDAAVGHCVVRGGSEPIIRLDNGSYTYIFPYNDSAESWTNIQSFASWLKAKDIQCLHLLPAFKFDDSHVTFPKSIPHGYARMAAEYKRFLSDNGIPCLDAKVVLLAANPDFLSWFYRIHLHWTAEAGVRAAEATVRKLNDELGVAADVDAVRRENFTRKVYPALFCTSWMAELGLEEDVEVLYPLDDGRFHLQIPSMGMDRTGGFHDTLIAQPYLKSAAHCHVAFLYGDRPVIQVENLSCANDTRVLVIKRCDARVVCPYLACAVRHLDVIDPRNFDGSIRTFIEKTKPDVVMFCTYMQTDAGDRFWELK